MCLLTFCPTNVTPDTTALLNGAYCNADGHGFAIVADDRLIVERGMNAEAMVEAFVAARRRHPDGPALFHSRMTTHGDTSLDNCHPFPVGGDARTVLAHNGVLPETVRPAKSDPRSDTRITAEDFLPTFGSLRTRRNRARFEQWMTPHNKMVLLTVDRRFTRRAYILNETSGIWDCGIWYSNNGYLSDAEALWPLDGASRDWPPFEPGPDQLYRCWICRGVIDVTEDACRSCGWCLDCGEMPYGCSCYRFTPAALDARIGSQAPRQPTEPAPRSSNTPGSPATVDKIFYPSNGVPAARLLLPPRPPNHT
jgi:glutamine amidotransferase